MSWKRLLFAHWPISARQLSPLVPIDYDLDTFDGSAWVGVVPFIMENVKLRGVAQIPGTDRFPEVNVRTYVRDKKSGQHGVYFFSLDVTNVLAVSIARAWYKLPYHAAYMRVTKSEGGWRYQSRRLLATQKTAFSAFYQGNAENLPPHKPGTIEHFLTERYALFTHSKSGLVRADIHHKPWVLESAEAEFTDLTLVSAQGIHLPQTPPLLHYSHRQDVIAWAPQKFS
jgi:uncharacterized protein